MVDTRLAPVVISSIFGAKIAGLYVLCGLVIAVLGGLLIEKLHMERYLEDIVVQNAACGRRRAEADGSGGGFPSPHRDGGNVQKGVPYVLAAVAIGAVIHNWIPEEWVVAVLGSKNPSAWCWRR
jgi:uncharacterized membrane protein YraQ (UPF0718 family)